jgi:hypothetical protein
MNSSVTNVVVSTDEVSKGATNGIIGGDGGSTGDYTECNPNADGSIVRVFRNGILREAYTLKDGKYGGIYLSWHDNGAPHCHYVYSNGKLINVVSILDKEGRECVLPNGEQTVWKLCYVTDRDGKQHNGMVKLKVLFGTKGVTPKCRDNEYSSRAEYAIVESISDSTGKQYKMASSSREGKVDQSYIIGSTVSPDGFDDDLEKDKPI